MKQKLMNLFLLIWCCVPVLTAQTWKPVGEGITTDDLNAVCFSDDQTAFAVGKNATMLKSTDSGQTWNKMNHGATTKELCAIQFPTASIGYAAGIDGTLIKTTNGGSTWSNISTNLPVNAQAGKLLGMRFQDASNGFIVGDPGLILQTTDGGQSWHNCNSVVTDGYFRSIEFTNATTAYCVGNEGKVKKSTDGGVTWNYFEQECKTSTSCFGVNMSGGEFGGLYPGTYEAHYVYPTAADLDYFKTKNLNLIRFPFRWERVQHELDGPLNSFDIDKMKEFVQAAEDRNMPIILDMHNFARRQINKQDILIAVQITREQLANCWRQLAQEFKDYNNIWGYDIMNEPHDMWYGMRWHQIAQAVIDSIRTVDTKTPIIVSGDRWSSPAYNHWTIYNDTLYKLKDPANNLIFQAHLYFDKDQSGSYTKTVDGRKVPSTYEEEGAYPEIGVDRMKPFVKWLGDHGVRGFVGEYGIPDDAADLEKWGLVLENFLQYLYDNKIPGTYWSAGPRWGNDRLAVQPAHNVDRPQMRFIEKFTNCKE